MRRPWVTVWTDVGTAGFLGWAIGRTPNTAAICHALMRGIMAAGPPDIIYHDNGRDYTSARMGGRSRRRKRPLPMAKLLRPGLTEVAGRKRWPGAMPDDVEASAHWAYLGIERRIALPYHPWSKPVESFFRAFFGQWENLVPGYCGNRPGARPEHVQDLVDTGRLLTMAEFVDVFEERVRLWNNCHICGDRTAAPVVAYGRHPDTAARLARIPDPQTLGFLIQDVRRKRVTTLGIRLGDHYYDSPELLIYAGATVTVRWDDGAPGFAYVTTPDGTVLAVPRGLKADWSGEFGEANRRAKVAARAQRRYIGAVRGLIAGACDEEEKDPTGAYRVVARRVLIERQQATGLADAALGAADQAARQQQARAELAAAPDEAPTTTVYEGDAELQDLRALRKKLG